MTPKAIVEEILRLSPQEQLHIVYEVYGTVAERHPEVFARETAPIPQWQLDLLEEDIRNPSPLSPLSWEEIKEQLLRGLKR